MTSYNKCLSCCVSRKTFNSLHNSRINKAWNYQWREKHLINLLVLGKGCVYFTIMWNKNATRWNVRFPLESMTRDCGVVVMLNMELRADVLTMLFNIYTKYTDRLWQFMWEKELNKAYIHIHVRIALRKWTWELRITPYWPWPFELHTLLLDLSGGISSGLESESFQSTVANKNLWHRLSPIHPYNWKIGYKLLKIFLNSKGCAVGSRYQPYTMNMVIS